MKKKEKASQQQQDDAEFETLFGEICAANPYNIELPTIEFLS